MTSFILKNNNISFNDIYKIVNENLNISLDSSVIERINKSRTYLEDKIIRSNESFYGINTGFGDLHNIKIKDDDLAKLQVNLIKSHACGSGDKIDSELVKLMLLLKIISLSKGFSGIKLKTVERLIFFFNKNINPIVYKYGSLGASGDLAPLSHLSLPLIGLGEVEYKDKIYKSEEILTKFKLEPLALGSKEGLALINGTQFMLASLINSTINSINLSKVILANPNFQLIVTVMLSDKEKTVTEYHELVSSYFSLKNKLYDLFSNFNQLTGLSLEFNKN